MIDLHNFYLAASISPSIQIRRFFYRNLHVRNRKIASASSPLPIPAHSKRDQSLFFFVLFLFEFVPPNDASVILPRSICTETNSS